VPDVPHVIPQITAVKSSKSRRCVLPPVSSHPRTARGTIQGQVTVAPSPRDRRTGHDPSVGAPMPGHDRAWPLVQTQRASPSCHRVANTELLPPFTVTSRCAGSFSAFHLRCAASAYQTMALFASSSSSSVPYVASASLQ
jgi:hypothetical protein